MTYVAVRMRPECWSDRPFLDGLEHDGGPVTVSGVATRARVSHTFLYDAAQAPLTVSDTNSQADTLIRRSRSR